MDACTVTASLIAITAFAVPDPGRHLAVQSGFFRVWRLPGSPRRTDHSAYFGPATISCLSFSAVDESDPNRGLKIVNAQGLCNGYLFLCANRCI